MNGMGRDRIDVIKRGLTGPTGPSGQEGVKDPPCPVSPARVQQVPIWVPRTLPYPSIPLRALRSRLSASIPYPSSFMTRDVGDVTIKGVVEGLT